MEKETIKTILVDIQKELPICLEYAPSNDLDGKLILNYRKKEYQFVLSCKKEVRLFVLNQLEEQKQQHATILLFAEHIPLKVKTALREQKIPYIEANGNLYLEQDDIYLFIDSNKKYSVSKKNVNRAFTKTGLKVLFHFLLQPDLVNKPQREIAEYTKVGLGNIPQIIDGLKTTGYLLPKNKKEYVWQKQKELLFRWVEDYEKILKPSLKKQNFQLRTNWFDIKLDSDFAVWGGESAADILTQYLRPEKYTLYTNELKVNLIKNYKLQPKNQGNVEVIEMFWNSKLNKKTAPPLLVYAELILEGGKRNKETAEMIFDEYIQSNL